MSLNSGFQERVRYRWAHFERALDDWETLRSQSLGMIVTVMRDTSEPALERYYELLRARAPLDRLTAAVDLLSKEVSRRMGTAQPLAGTVLVPVASESCGSGELRGR